MLGLVANHQKLGEAWILPEGANPDDTLIFGLLASGTVIKQICVVLSHPVYGPFVKAALGNANIHGVELPLAFVIQAPLASLSGSL